MHPTPCGTRNRKSAGTAPACRRGCLPAPSNTAPRPPAPPPPRATPPREPAPAATTGLRHCPPTTPPPLCTTVVTPSAAATARPVGLNIAAHPAANPATSAAAGRSSARASAANDAATAAKNAMGVSKWNPPNNAGHDQLRYTSANRNVGRADPALTRRPPIAPARLPPGRPRRC